MATIVSTEVIGLDALRRDLEALGPQARQVLAGAMYAEAQTIMTASKAQVPVDTGTLKNSGEVQPPAVEPDGTIAVRLGYGGAASDYALIQHEDLTLKHPGGGNAKYLERPFIAAMNGLTVRLRTRLGQALGFGKRGVATGGVPGGDFGGHGLL